MVNKCLNLFRYFIYIFFIKYGNWTFLFMLIIYNLLYVPSDNNLKEIDLLICSKSYLPNYLQFDSFFQIQNFLVSDDQIFPISINIDMAEYSMLENSLEEIDYPIVSDQVGKPLKYIQFHQLPKWSTMDEQSWINFCNIILQTGQGNWTHDFERVFLKYVWGDPGFKQYMSIKYTSWRYSESFYIKYLLYEMKELSMRMEGWKILREYAGNRLCSKRKCGYLFRCYDTYLRLYFKYELVQCQSWAYSFNKRIRWLRMEYYWRKPWVIAINLIVKGLFISACIYAGYSYLP